MSLLLDTHILLWWLENGGKLKAEHKRRLQRLSPAQPALLASISLWEIATLSSLGRIRLSMPLKAWLEAATAPPLVQVVPLDAAIATEVAMLPDTFHRDPADRLIVATARVLGCRLLTYDQRIIDAGLAKTL